MNDQDRASFDPRIADWLEDDPNTAPEPTLQIVLAAFPSIRQRHALRLPRRFPSMSTIPKLAIGAAVVTAVALGGFMILRPPPQPSVGSPGRTASPSVTSVPSGSVDLTTWAPFTSPWYGYSAAIPPPFKAHPASRFWVVPESSTTSPAEWDDFHPDTGTATLGGSSIDLPAGITFDAWAAAYRQGQVNASLPPICDETTQPLDPIVIDGHPGVARTGCGVIEALVLVDGKVYSFAGSPGFSGPQLGVPADFRAMVEAWFTTIRLDPASAVEPPAASHSPAAS